MSTPDLTRRIAFQGLAAVGAAVALAGCTGVTPEAAPTTGAVLVDAADVPVGGGVVVADAGVVVTQPTAGEFEAFAATCTHQGAALARVAQDGIECDLHGSRFAITDGSPTKGPATSALTRVAITVDGARILVA